MRQTRVSNMSLINKSLTFYYNINKLIKVHRKQLSISYIYVLKANSLKLNTHFLISSHFFHVGPGFVYSMYPTVSQFA